MRILPGHLARLVCGLLAMAIVTMVTTLLLARVRQEHHRAHCLAVLRAIGLGIHAYTEDSTGHLPPDLNSLYPGYVSSLRTFLCPATEDYHDYDSTQHMLRGLPFEPNGGSYSYVCPAKAIENVPAPHATKMLAHDRSGNHAAGANVLFLDGHVEWRKDFSPSNRGADEGTHGKMREQGSRNETQRSR